MEPLKVWEGEFGEAYTNRNVIDYRVRLPAFGQMLEGLTIRSVLEVGCNRGHNLTVMTELLGDESHVVGLEPNRYALELARAANVKAGLLRSHAFDLPFRDGCFDLVFTAGVLIHIPLADLPRALSELYRVSMRYVLAVEYFAEEETPIPYRDSEDLLWKRDFLSHYESSFPALTMIRSGYCGVEDGFDRTHWWLFEKNVSSG
jgi:pseudaminic acid biosynthesis-associated methylase